MSEFEKMLTYPKIETLFVRDDKFKVDTTKLRMEEFGLVNSWFVTEKIHGTNIRVRYDGETVKIAGRKSENTSDIPGDLYKFLLETFTVAKMAGKFGYLGDAQNPSHFDYVDIFGEGCGPGIQKGGGDYATKKTLVVFDVKIGQYWLEPTDFIDVANFFGLTVAPVIHLGANTNWIIDHVRGGNHSILAEMNTNKQDRLAEGIVARTTPGLFTRYGTRLMFKLKYEDFALPVLATSTADSV